MDKEQYQLLYDLELTHWWYVGMRKVLHSLLSFLPSGLRVLDAGCGTGGTSASLAKFGSVYGIDFSPDAVQLCVRRPSVKIVRGSITHLPFQNESFDLVTSLDVLYHRGVQSDELALAEFFRVLRPGGWVAVRVPAFEFHRGGHDEAVHTRHRYTAPELRDKVEAAGFSVDRVTYANTFLLPVAVLSRRLRRGSDFEAEP